MSRLVTISEAADALGVSVQTLRRWEAEGRLKPDERTSGGQRFADSYLTGSQQRRLLKVSKGTANAI